MFVCQKAGIVQGCGRLEKTREIRMIYVTPSYQRQGIGTAVINRIEKFAKTKGLKSVFIKALWPAVGFYKKLGYKKVKKDKKGLVRMEKKLR